MPLHALCATWERGVGGCHCHLPCWVPSRRLKTSFTTMGLSLMSLGRAWITSFYRGRGVGTIRSPHPFPKGPTASPGEGSSPMCPPPPTEAADSPASVDRARHPQANDAHLKSQAHRGKTPPEMQHLRRCFPHLGNTSVSAVPCRPRDNCVYTQDATVVLS